MGEGIKTYEKEEWAGLWFIHNTLSSTPKKGTVGLMIMLGWFNVYCRQTMSMKFN